MLSPCWDILSKRNQTELRAKFVNNSQIVFKSGESLDNLRGETLHGVVVDEVREQHPDLWPMILRPMLSTTKGWAAFVSTPRGHDSFFDLAETAMRDQSGLWEYFHAPSTANPLFTQEEFAAAKSDMSEAQFAQEILSEFRDLQQGQAYINHTQENQKRYNPFSFDVSPLNPYLPIVVGMDFNVGLMCWELGQNKGEDWYWFDEIAVRRTHTQEAVGLLIDKVKEHKPGIIIVGDSTGKAQKTSAAGQSDYSIIFEALDRAGVRWENRTPEANPPVKDRVNVFNAKLKAADGTHHCWYHPDRCKFLSRDMSRVLWKAGATGAILDQSKDPDLTHASDAAGYPMHAMTTQWSGQVGGLRVIRR